MVRWTTVGLALAGCAGDIDGDGLSNREEIELGLDAEAADTDGDGLDDGDEVELGTDPLDPDTDGDGLDDGSEVTEQTDPLDPDTDGDGYLDFDELAEGADPTDAQSVIYRGGWPYHRGKTDLGDPGTADRLAPGAQVGRFVGIDQYGDQVDLYDWAGSDQPIVLDVSATWCPPCNDLADWLSNGDEAMSEEWPGVRRAVRSGAIRWVTLMYQDGSRNPATRATCEAWDDAYPHERIPVIADPDAEMTRHLNATGLPALRLIEADLTLSDLGEAPYWDVLSELSSRL